MARRRVVVKEEAGFSIDEEICKAIDWDYMLNITVIGRRRSGKTSWALQKMYSVFGDWDEVLRHCFFDPEEAIQHLETQHDFRNKEPCLLIDDAGVVLHKTRRMDETVKNIVDLIARMGGHRLHVLILTSPSFDIVKDLRDNMHIIVKVERVGKAKSVAKFFRLVPKVTVTGGTPYVKELGAEVFNPILPSKVYIRYLEMREEFYRRIAGSLRDEDEDDNF